MRETRLPASRLTTPCDPERLPFTTTAELDELSEVVGQPRAVEAIQLGIAMPHDGYNVFVMGPPGTGRHSIVRRALDRDAAQRPAPPDRCYVHNFDEEHRPLALTLPAGRGAMLKQRMQRLVDDLRAAIPAAFETDRYRAEKLRVEQELATRQETALAELRERARVVDLDLVRTPAGFALAPVRDGAILEPEEFGRLPEEDRKRIGDAIGRFQRELEEVVQKAPVWKRETQRKLRDLDRAFTKEAVVALVDEVRREIDGLPNLTTYLDAVEADVVENADRFRQTREGDAPTILGIPLVREPQDIPLRRYSVNVLVDHARSTGAPVVYEDHPTYANLVGRMEHLSHMGTLVTDFTLIKAGALHRANGGTLILDAHKLLTQPFAWEAIKRALHAHEVKIESLERAVGILATVSLEPEPIPLKVKVVLVGEPHIYYLLQRFDPEFIELFKVVAEFQPDMPRNDETTPLYAHLVATLARRAGLSRLDRGAIARGVEHASRLSGDAQRLTCHLREVVDVLEEADFRSRAEGRDAVTATDVDASIEAQRHRVGRLRERLEDAVDRGTLLIATDGDAVGQVNGLSVFQIGAVAFGHPSRITARVRMGDGTVLDIEREVALGGPIHSKGVLILSGFLAGRYLPGLPLTLKASLVFEQSYGGVDGDSASCAELCALLSALAEAPVRQSLALTGSVNQHGLVQAIGGVNEKVEGFFDVCRRRGLTGTQGVIVPASNVQHLMLRADVVEAVAAGRFHVHAIETVDEAIELLTGVPAGERGADGRFPADTLNGRVERRLVELAESARDFRAGPRPSSSLPPSAP